MLANRCESAHGVQVDEKATGDDMDETNEGKFLHEFGNASGCSDSKSVDFPVPLCVLELFSRQARVSVKMTRHSKAMAAMTPKA